LPNGCDQESRPASLPPPVAAITTELLVDAIDGLW
jgi:hypothetical protein